MPVSLVTSPYCKLHVACRDWVLLRHLMQLMCCAAGEMLHVAEPFLERNLHPTVIIRGFVRALEDALKVIEELAFPVDVDNNDQMFKIISSCIGTKFTSRFGTLMPACPALSALAACSVSCFAVAAQQQYSAIVGKASYSL